MPPPSGSSLEPQGRGASSPPGKASQKSRVGWFRAKRPLIQFVLLLGILMGLFELACATSFVKETVFPASLRANARISGWILGLVEDSVIVSGESIRSPRYSLTIARGCDAMDPAALFVSGVLAFPTAFLPKLPGILVGTLSLLVLNLLRIVTLFYVGIYYPKLFHIMHVDVWQAIFIFLAVLFWTLWARWAMRVPTPHPDVTPVSS